MFIILFMLTWNLGIESLKSIDYDHYSTIKEIKFKKLEKLKAFSIIINDRII